MAELTLERDFSAPIEKVFAFVSQTEHLLKWWGPESIHITEHNLALDKPGPWMSVMENDSGGRFKVSGQVTHVDAPNSIGFTWAWHDDEDRRGGESHVTIRLEAGQSGGTHFTLHHVDLADDEAAQNHNQGWTSSLRKLEAMAT